ncbi:MAG: hypothetical protein O3C57_07620 [Verrucomicrobia bacterium]|nr:hypothetical protein [Verrucomicrobiota bacterium]
MRKQEFFADAALINNEIYQRVIKSRTDVARTAQSDVYENFARFLGFDGDLLVHDEGQEKFVMTQSFEDAGDSVTFAHGRIAVYAQP